MDTLRILKVLADETRLRILKLIREEGLCVCEIQGALDLNQSNTSRHLARLHDAGLVLQSKNGQWINSDIAFSDIPIEYEDEQNMLFFVFYNSDISDDIKQISEKDLLVKNWNITKFIKRGLNKKN